MPHLIIPDLISEYRIDPTVLGNRLSWKRFRLLVEGLLSADTRTNRHFQAKKKTNEGVNSDRAEHPRYP